MAQFEVWTEPKVSHWPSSALNIPARTSLRIPAQSDASAHSTEALRRARNVGSAGARVASGQSTLRASSSGSGRKLPGSG